MQIINEIIQMANARPYVTTQDIVRLFKKKYSRQYIQRIINQLVERGELLKTGGTKGAKYVIPQKIVDLNLIYRRIFINKNLEEHEVWNEIENKIPFKKFLKENVYNLLIYAFSEMLNNSIDHSRSKEIGIKVENMPNVINFMVTDRGIGAFNNILEKYPALKNPENVVQELLKGKLTTDSKRHTGEGIFFTIKVCDSFYLNSRGHQLVNDKDTGEFGYRKIAEKKDGTTVFCEIKKDREDSLSSVFEKFYTNPKEQSFDKTEIKINLYSIGRACISRSQAKRVLSRLENFKKVILDFENVTTVGQGFADEIFRIFKSENPRISIESINMNKSVEFMVKRATKR